MIKGFDFFIDKARTKGKINTAVVNPIDVISLSSAIDAAKCGIINPIIFGSKSKIEKIAKENSINLFGYDIVDCASEEEVLKQATEYCRLGRAKILMKGKIHTSHLMKAVVSRENELRTDSQISHVFVLNVPNYHKLLFITDAAININPTLAQKEKIIYNAINFIKKVGIERPKVALLSSVEVANGAIQSSIDAEELVKSELLQEGAIVEGPLAFDNAISAKSADIKGIKTQIAGDVDLLVAPNLDVGNVLFKSLVYLAKAEIAGIVLGAKVPIILTSRSDSINARLVSAALCSMVVDE